MRNLSPIVLQFFLHCYYSPDPFSKVSIPVHTPAIKEGIKKLLHHGLIEQSEIVHVYPVTDKGKFHIDALLSLPFPVVTYTTPPKEE